VTAGTNFAGIEIGIGIGRLTEDGRTFGAISSGALSLGKGSASTFLTVMAAAHPSSRLELTASYTAGRTRAAPGGGLFSNVGIFASDAFAIGAIRHGAFVTGDMLGFQLAQPIRVSDAQVALSLPVALDADGAIVRAARRLNLAPRGREIDLQLAYRTPLDMFAGRAGRESLRAFVMARLNPGHDANAPSDYAAGVRYNIVF
jgi:hypothetical protein